MARFVQKGGSIDYTPGSAVAVGAVVALGTVAVGVADRPIAANEKGALVVEGVFAFPKATGSGSAITAFSAVYWDVDPGVITTTSSGNIPAGYTVAAAADGDAEVMVKIG